MFTHDFIKDFDKIFNETEPFAFVRFHDGEHAILEGVPYRAASRWTSAGGDVWLQDELKEVLHTDLDRFYIGVSPPCCTPQATVYYRTCMRRDPAITTYATLFQFKNFRRMGLFKQRFLNALIIGSGEVDIKVPHNGVVNTWDVDAVVDAMLIAERPIFVAAGPCANILIYRYWQRQVPEKRQFVIDVGAAFDLQIHRKETREHHKRTSGVFSHVCTWDDWKPFGVMSDTRRRELEAESNSKAKHRQLQDQGFGQNDPRIIPNKTKPKPVKGTNYGNTLPRAKRGKATK